MRNRLRHPRPERSKGCALVDGHHSSPPPSRRAARVVLRNQRKHFSRPHEQSNHPPPSPPPLDQRRWGAPTTPLIPPLVSPPSHRRPQKILLSSTQSLPVGAPHAQLARRRPARLRAREIAMASEEARTGIKLERGKGERKRAGRGDGGEPERGTNKRKKRFRGSTHHLTRKGGRASREKAAKQV